MKRKIMIVGLIVSMLAAVGCSKKGKEETTTTEAVEVTTEATTENTTEVTTEEKVVSYEEVYADVLHHTYDILASAEDIFDEITDEEMGIYEIRMYSDAETALKSVGYCYKDLNDDDIPELIIGSDDGMILAIYGIDGDTPAFLVSGRTRNAKRLLADGKTIHTFGSGGAAYSIFGTMQIAKDGKGIEWIDCYFTYPDNTNNIHYYHNTTGVWDPEQAEEIFVSDEEFWAPSELEDGSFVRDLGLTYFIDMPGGTYEQTNNSQTGDINVQIATGAGFDVLLAEDARARLTNYQTLNISTDEFTNEVAFIPIEGGLSDITFYEIEYSASSEGNQWFKNNKEIGYIPFVAEDEQLVVTMSFPGDMPTIGFSYIGATGETLYYAIGLSGFDGSVQISPYFPDNY